MLKPQILLDTSPLITLCTFRVKGQFVVDYLLEVASIVVAETVAAEATVNPAYSDAAVIDSLLKTKRIERVAVPSTPLDAVIDGYTKLGRGERDTIRLGLTMPTMPIVLDDYLAFVIATRFELKPILLLDLIVSFVENALAKEIIDQIAPRYSAPFVDHSRYKLGGA